MEVRPIPVDLKRKATGDVIADESWNLSKCQKLSPEKFTVRLEISSPDSFSVKPLPVEGYKFPGEAACFERLSECLFNVRDLSFLIKYNYMIVIIIITIRLTY